MLTEHQAIDLEKLAAFIDGRLSGEQKAQVEGRLLRDEDYYEIFLETVRFQQEQDAAGTAIQEDAEVAAPVVWWRSWRLAVPLAAAALLVVVINLVFSGRSPSTSDWVAQLDPAAIVAREGWADPGWSRLRAANIVEGRYRPEEIAFRLGVRAVDLRVALVAGDRDAARTLATVLKQLAHAADLFPVSSAYGDLSRQIRSVEPDALVAQAAEIERSMFGSLEDRPLEARRLALGAWSEAGRLAARSHNASALARVVRDDPGFGSIDEIATEMETLETILERPEPGEEEFDDAVAAFQRIASNLAG